MPFSDSRSLDQCKAKAAIDLKIRREKLNRLAEDFGINDNSYVNDQVLRDSFHNQRRSLQNQIAMLEKLQQCKTMLEYVMIEINIPPLRW